jgi:hypothetical protein
MCAWPLSPVPIIPILILSAKGFETESKGCNALIPATPSDIFFTNFRLDTFMGLGWDNSGSFNKSLHKKTDCIP